MKLRYAVLGLGGIVLLAATSSCGLLSGPAQPIVVTNNVPSGSDSGIAVLLAVAGFAAFLLLGVAIVMGMMWHSEKRRRTAAEDTVVALTGRPMSQLGLMMAAPMSTERFQAQLSR
jgi:hypothetical protein